MKSVISVVDLCDYVEKYNPFAVRDEKGALAFFLDIADAYRDMINRVYIASHGGYFDFVLFLVEQYEFSNIEASCYVKKGRIYGFRDDEPLLLDWSDQSMYYIELRAILRFLLAIISDITFKEDIFVVAIEKFDKDIRKK